MLQAGQFIDDYRIISSLATGGMGEIYLAEEMPLGRQVVIKTIRPEAIKYPNSEEARKVIFLFWREATAIAKLNHPNILPLYKFGGATIATNSLMYMVMPYCQEKSLADWMYSQGKTSLSPQEVDIILRPIAEALQYAHDQGIIHLDIKPSNFLVRNRTNEIGNLNLQLMDFGIAKFSAASGMSQTIRGSLEYMAPEQWEGQSTFATDQYALAIMVYQLLTGQVPFKASSFEHFWNQHRHVQPQPPSSFNHMIPPSIDNVLLRALAKNPIDRFPTVIAFAEAFKQALQYSSTQYASIYLTLTLSSEEAIKGTTHTLVLPSGEQLPIMVPPGAYSGQIITIQRQFAPMIAVAIQIPNVPPPFLPSKSSSSTWNNTPRLIAPPTMPSLPYHLQSSSWNRFSQPLTSPTPTMTPYDKTASRHLSVQSSALKNVIHGNVRYHVITGIIAIVILSIGLFVYNYYPDARGIYTGSLQTTPGSISTQMTLDISQQNGQRIEGTCTTVNVILGTNTFTLESGIIDKFDTIQFTLTGTDWAGNSLTRTFMGATQNGGGWKGTFSDTDGNHGTWSVS